ncbi:MAG: hypothetical protein KC613_07590, partial [Myxococcales bacterium]|nr:hypothetical protein [Myxococcales bacterium]
LAWAGLTALLAGCTAAAGGGAGLIIGLLSALTLYACIADTPPEPEPADAGRADGALDGGAKDGGPADGALEAGPGDMDVDGGFWESCCVDGVVDTCYCPANTACNYGWYQDCGDGTCAYDQCGGLDQGPPDQGVPDQSVPDQSVPDRGAPDEGVVDQGVEEPDGGFWEPCCVDGVIDACYCPAGAACNYGWFQDCGEGTCIVPGGDCP